MMILDSSGAKFTADPTCPCCYGMGRYVIGYSGREDDGNAALWEDCDCFIPYDVRETSGGKNNGV